MFPVQNAPVSLEPEPNPQLRGCREVLLSRQEPSGRRQERLRSGAEAKALLVSSDLVFTTALAQDWVWPSWSIQWALVDMAEAYFFLKRMGESGLCHQHKERGDIQGSEHAGRGGARL